MFGDKAYQCKMGYFVVDLAQGKDDAVSGGKNHENNHNDDKKPMFKSSNSDVMLIHSFFPRFKDTVSDFHRQTGQTKNSR